MKKFTKDYKLPEISSEVYAEYFGGLTPCVYDIETTGLGVEQKVIMTAMLIPSENGVRITQFLAENHYEEDRVLNASMELLRDEGVDYIVTFNGLSFDAPFTNRRLEFFGSSHRLGHYDLDLYRFFKKYSILPDCLDSLSQKSVEGYFGIDRYRQDVISGRESVRLFNEYALSQNSVIEKVILTHNREDVLQLYRLLLLASSSDFTGILREPNPSLIFGNGDLTGGSSDVSFHYAISDYGFPVAKGALTARPLLSKKCMRVTGRQTGEPLNRVFFSENAGDYQGEFKSSTSSIEIVLPVEAKGNSQFVNLGNLSFEPAVFEALEVSELGAYESGYLILKEDGIISYKAMNVLTKLILESIMSS